MISKTCKEGAASRTAVFSALRAAPPPPPAAAASLPRRPTPLLWQVLITADYVYNRYLIVFKRKLLRLIGMRNEFCFGRPGENINFFASNGNIVIYVSLITKFNNSISIPVCQICQIKQLFCSRLLLYSNWLFKLESVGKIFSEFLGKTDRNGCFSWRCCTVQGLLALPWKFALWECNSVNANKISLW